MRRAGQLAGLVPRPDADPEADRHRRASGIRSVTTRMPEGSVVISMPARDRAGPAPRSEARRDGTVSRATVAVATAVSGATARHRDHGRRRCGSPPPPRHRRADSGPRSPNSPRTSSSKASSNETYSRSPSELVGRRRRRRGRRSRSTSRRGLDHRSPRLATGRRRAGGARRPGAATPCRSGRRRRP